MEKALEILKQLNGVGAWERWCLSLPSNTKINEAISELEEDMKPKTCDGCKHYEEKQCTNENSIAFGGINAVYKDDFCNDFEPKEQL